MSVATTVLGSQKLINALFRVCVRLRWAGCVLGHNNDEVLLVHILKLSEGSLSLFPKALVEVVRSSRVVS